MPNVKYCRKCGSENSGSSQFCTACGSPFEAPASAAHKNNAVPPAEGRLEGSNRNKPDAPTAQKPYGFNSKPKLKTVSTTQLVGYIALIAIGIVVFFIGQQQVDTYSGFPWYEPYQSKAEQGSLLRVLGAIACIGGILGFVRFYFRKQ